MVLKYYTTNKNASAVYDFYDLSRIRLMNNNLEQFINIWNMVVDGLEDVPVVVGAAASFGADADASIQRFEGEEGINTDPRNMATESLSFLIKRIDTDKVTWDSCMVPYRPKMLNKHSMFSLLGSYLKQATFSNRGLPPLCCSHDGHGNFGACCTS